MKEIIILIMVVTSVGCTKTKYKTPSTGIPTDSIPNPIEILTPITFLGVVELSDIRTNMATAVCNNKILAAGGESYSAYPIVDIVDFTVDTLSNHVLSVARHELAAIGCSTKAFFAGGLKKDRSAPVSRVDIYDAVTKAWNTAELSIARTNMALAILGNKVFFAGGNTGSNITSRIDIYDFQTESWSIRELAEPRMDLTAAVLGNKIFFAGGTTGSKYSDMIDIYDSTSKSWSTSKLLSPVIGITSFVAFDKAYFAGQPENSSKALVQVYDFVTGIWSSFNLSGPKSSVAMGYSNGKIAFIGGRVDALNSTKKIELYDLSTHQITYSQMYYDALWQAIVSKDNYIYLTTRFTDQIYKIKVI